MSDNSEGTWPCGSPEEPPRVAGLWGDGGPGEAFTGDCLFSLVEELKASSPDFPEVSKGIYVQEVAPNSPSQR